MNEKKRCPFILLTGIFEDDIIAVTVHRFLLLKDQPITEQDLIDCYAE